MSADHPSPSRVHLLRHGEPVLAGTMLGRTDSAATPAGIAACAARAADLAFDALICSDLARAADCAAAIGGPRGLPPRADARWREIDFGDWDGLAPAAIDAAALARFRDDPDGCPPPGGERWSALVARVAAALDGLPRGPVLVVTHDGAMRAALALLCGLDRRQVWAFDLPYAALLTLAVWPGPARTAQIVGLRT